MILFMRNFQSTDGCLPGGGNREEWGETALNGQCTWELENGGDRTVL